MVALDYEWGLKALHDHQRLFLTLKARLARKRDCKTPVRSGQIWYALPDGAYTVLIEKRAPRDQKNTAVRQCFGIIECGEWKPIPNRLAGPCALEIHFVDGVTPDLDTGHGRPGLLLCEPHSRRRKSIALLKFNRALWIRVESNARRGHGQLRVRGVDPSSPRRPGSFPFWTAWGISAKHGEELLSHVNHISRCSPRDGVRMCDLSPPVLHPRGPTSSFAPLDVRFFRSDLKRSGRTS